jgi:hypothetical protein
MTGKTPDIMIKLRKVWKISLNAAAGNANSDREEDERAWKAFQLLENIEKLLEDFLNDQHKQ